MIGFACLFAIGAACILQDKCEREVKHIYRPTLAQIERQLDAENERLDREIEALLYEHRKLCKG